MNLRSLFTVVLILFSLFLKGQEKQKEIDSLKAVIAGSPHDSIKVKARVKLGALYGYDKERSVPLFEEAMEIAEGLQDKQWLARSMGGITTHYYYAGEYYKAIGMQEQVVELWKEADDQTRLAAAYGNMGILYRRTGDFPRSLKCLQQAMKINEGLDDPLELASTYNNIGNLYNTFGEPEKGLEYHLRALDLRTAQGDSISLIATYNNLANMYESLDQDSIALDYYARSLQAGREAGLYESVANALNNSAIVYLKRKDFGRTREALQEALELRKEYDNPQSVAQTYNNFCDMHSALGEYEQAAEYAMKALKITDEHFVPAVRINALKNLSVCYRELGDHKKAYDYVMDYRALKDSIYNKEQTIELARQDLRYQFDKEQLADSLARAKQAEIDLVQREEEKARQKVYTTAGAGVGILMTLLAIVLFVGYRNKHKANRQINEQKLQLQLKNEEIIDSITYAKNLQDAILPSIGLIKEHLPDSFLLYKPKDIVSGDFYWFEAIDGVKYWAAVDCTGHGVPGAMVSVLGANSLERCVKEFGLRQPAAILDKLNELVDEAFRKSEKAVQDGMDIALLALKPGGQLEYAGANNPLWIIRSEGELEEIKGDKQPIGRYDQRTAFNNHTIQVAQGDSVYVFSDGYSDQFGGEQGKKFKPKSLKKLLMSIQERPMSEQGQQLEQHFDSWSEGYEQIDDVCIIGVRV